MNQPITFKSNRKCQFESRSFTRPYF